jgi:hypothetical protein
MEQNSRYERQISLSDSSSAKPREVGMGRLYGERCEARGEPNPYKIKNFAEYYAKYQEYLDKQRDPKVEAGGTMVFSDQPQEEQDFAATIRQSITQYSADDAYHFMKRLAGRLIARHVSSVLRTR